MISGKVFSEWKQMDTTRRSRVVSIRRHEENALLDIIPRALTWVTKPLMMPPTEIKTVTVLRDTSRSLRDSHPNTVLFQPHCSFKSASKSTVRVHFDQVPKKIRPQSAHVFTQYDRPTPPPEKKRPQSATTYRKPRFEVAVRRERPTSAVSQKSGSTDISDIISELSRNLDTVAVGPPPRLKKRIWRPKKKNEGIHHTPPPPPPVRSKWTNDRSQLEVKPETRDHRRQNDLAWVRPYKYRTNFHSYRSEKFIKEKMDLIHRTGKPDFAKKFPVYGHCAAKQRCCYRPSKSVTRVDHHHRVGSVSLPHPDRDVETPPPPPMMIHRSLGEENLSHFTTGDNGGDEGEEEEQGESNNNGSYAFTYEGNEDMNSTYSTEQETEDWEKTSDAENTTGRTADDLTDLRRPESPPATYRKSTEEDDDLYFLTKNRKGDSNKNNNKTSDVSQTEPKNLSGTFTRNDFKSDQGNADVESYKSVRANDEENEQEVGEDMYDFSDIDDGLYDDIPEIPSDIEDALDKYKPRLSNRPKSAKHKTRADDSESEAKEVDTD